MPPRVCDLEHGVHIESLEQLYMTQTVPSAPTCIIFIRISDIVSMTSEFTRALASKKLIWLRRSNVLRGTI